MVTFYRVGKPVGNSSSRGKFIKRSSPSGGEVISIDRASHETAKVAAERKLEERFNYDKPQSNIRALKQAR